MLSSLFYKAIDTIFSGVFIPAIVMLSVAVPISTSNIYVRSPFFLLGYLFVTYKLINFFNWVYNWSLAYGVAVYMYTVINPILFIIQFLYGFGVVRF